MNVNRRWQVGYPEVRFQQRSPRSCRKEAAERCVDRLRTVVARLLRLGSVSRGGGCAHEIQALLRAQSKRCVQVALLRGIDGRVLVRKERLRYGG